MCIRDRYSNVNEMTLITGPTPDQSYNVEMHYFYYPPTIVQGQITALDTVGFNPGAAYTNGLYQNVPLTGGSGSGATADILVAGGVVNTVTIKFGGSIKSVIRFLPMQIILVVLAPDLLLT